MVLQVIFNPPSAVEGIYSPIAVFGLYRKDLFVGKVKRGHCISRNGHKKSNRSG